MIIREFTEDGSQDLGDDTTVTYSLRRTKLTLKQINKLRRMSDLRNYEQKAKLKHIQAQYGPQSGGGGDEPNLF